ncbi:hypothetical protein ACKFR8_00315 [Corynebacterium axilliensis]|uniref:hypothetical protein n=1 Tax=Corynebacterium sp. YSMAA5_1_F9 TaxID=3383591 RepID=UPI0038CF5E15
MSPYIRTVKTASGATAVQVVWSEHRGSKKLQQVGSGHSPDQVEQLKVQARRLIDADQLTLDLGVEPSASRGTTDDPVPVTAQRAGYLLDCIDACFNELGLAVATGDDQVFRDLVRARLINPSE